MSNNYSNCHIDNRFGCSVVIQLLVFLYKKLVLVCTIKTSLGLEILKVHFGYFWGGTVCRLSF